MQLSLPAGGKNETKADSFLLFKLRKTSLQNGALTETLYSMCSRNVSEYPMILKFKIIYTYDGNFYLYNNASLKLFYLNKSDGQPPKLNDQGLFVPVESNFLVIERVERRKNAISF